MGRRRKVAPDGARPRVDWQPTLLARARQLAQLSQEQAAEAATAKGAPMTRAALCQWEQGKTRPNGREIAALAEVYRVKREFFFHQEPAAPYPPPVVEA